MLLASFNLTLTGFIRIVAVVVFTLDPGQVITPYSRVLCCLAAQYRLKVLISPSACPFI